MDKNEANNLLDKIEAEFDKLHEELLQLMYKDAYNKLLISACQNKMTNLMNKYEKITTKKEKEYICCLN
jgi:hypothetical protein